MSALLERVIDGSDKKMNLVCIPYAGGKDMDKWKIYTDSFGIKQFEGKQKRCLNKKETLERCHFTEPRS